MTLHAEVLEKRQALEERFSRLSIIVRGMAHEMRPADEDMVQIGLMKLWELIVGTGAEYPDCYLIASSRNAMIDRVRYQIKRQREEEIEVSDEEYRKREEEISEIFDDCHNCDLDDLLSCLPAHVAKAFALHVFEERSLKEVSEIMYKPVAVVRNWIRKAKEKLKRDLE